MKQFHQWLNEHQLKLFTPPDDVPLSGGGIWQPGDRVVLIQPVVTNGGRGQTLPIGTKGTVTHSYDSDSESIGVEFDGNIYIGMFKKPELRLHKIKRMRQL